MNKITKKCPFSSTENWAEDKISKAHVMLAMEAELILPFIEKIDFQALIVNIKEWYIKYQIYELDTFLRQVFLDKYQSSCNQERLRSPEWYSTLHILFEKPPEDARAIYATLTLLFHIALMDIIIVYLLSKKWVSKQRWLWLLFANMSRSNWPINSTKTLTDFVLNINFIEPWIVDAIIEFNKRSSLGCPFYNHPYSREWVKRVYDIIERKLSSLM